MSRYFTKARFRMAVECPTKLFYARQPDLYTNSSLEDPFLKALADGGFQVGELAKLMHPGGVEITSRTHEEQVVETRALLTRDEVTIFEAAICHGDLFVRVDVLRKCGDRVEIVEVKAKSFDSRKPDLFGSPGRIRSDWLPYLQDVAFQCHVFRLAYPQLDARGFLMLADTSTRSTVDGLNRRFRVRRRDGRPVVDVAPGTDALALGEPVLTAVNVDAYVRAIMVDRLRAPGEERPWADRIEQFAGAWRDGRRLGPVIGKHCGACEFRVRTGDASSRSGFEECWATPLIAEPQDLPGGTVLDLWNFRGKTPLIERGTLRLAEVTKDDLKFKPGDGRLSTSERQWMQISGDWPGGGPFFLHRELMRREMARWAWPLHFIDFETARAALPFRKGQRPYAQVAFQFSHHIMEENGRAAHRTQFLDTAPGSDPNLAFLRALRSALGEAGTVFMWSHHEQTVLNELFRELQDGPEPPADAAELAAFTVTLTDGPRTLYDLCKLAEHGFFHPATKGSCSIKRVLPAVLGSSALLRARYSKPVYGARWGIPSHNFREQIWWHADGAGAKDPYTFLGPVFRDLEPSLLSELESAEKLAIAEGGAAASAYARLQFEYLQGDERRYIEKALLRYCELDTLAMVMIVEAWREWCLAPDAVPSVPPRLERVPAL
ncbi:DUF2779 domain-containing protein [Belnapia moabensis]|uniref:DUF2779 domain-containing protein n=1 Tax=Belnapia moabensis TaxID=365533 RepID=UPI000694FFA0|nr:DUF2779 domain-containing protein [Belnapia moabensis]